MGVKLKLVQYPCRSGWPSGVRGAVQAFVFVAVVEVVAGGAWAPRNAGANKTPAITLARALDETPKRFFI
ncbi:MAG: hypothetical protein DMG32_23810 [Acidobacteria bacterium]|nr:MAG: hypothetical protein DMG32_23810 [Acidobacteriota bacterium]